MAGAAFTSVLGAATAAAGFVVSFSFGVSLAVSEDLCVSEVLFSAAAGFGALLMRVHVSLWQRKPIRQPVNVSLVGES